MSIICFDAFNYKNCGDHNDHVETMDRQDRRNRPIKFLDDGGDCDNRDDHMETRLYGSTVSISGYDLLILHTFLGHPVM